MSVHNSQRLNPKQSGRPPVCFTPANLVDTNLLLKEAIQKLSPEIRGEVVLRCDELVQLQCSYECCEKTFTYLLQLVAKAKPVDKKIVFTYNLLSPKSGQRNNRFRTETLHHTVPHKHIIACGRCSRNGKANQ